MDSALLADLVPIKALSPDHCQELAEKSEVAELAKGKFLYHKGDESKQIVYVLQGEIELISDGGARKKIVGGLKTSKLPLEQGSVCQFSAIANSDVQYLKVDSNLLDIMLTWEQSGGYEVQELDEAGGDDWMARILQAKVFHHIPPANIQSIFMRMQAKHFRAGESVIEQGEEGGHFYIVREGSCDVVRKTRKNPEGVMLARLNAGDNFGEEALISGGKRNASVVMVTDGVLMSLSKADFLELMNEPVMQWVSFSDGKRMAIEGAVWLDVRLPQEYQARHLSGSANIPLPILRSRLDKLDRERKYLICCDTGRRSSTATYIMTQNGFDAYVLQHGLQAVTTDDLVS